MMGSWREDSVVEIGERVESEEGERGELVVILVCCPRSRFMVTGEGREKEVGVIRWGKVGEV